MQSVSNGENLHEISKPVYLGRNKKNVSKLLSGENFTQNA